MITLHSHSGLWRTCSTTLTSQCDPKCLDYQPCSSWTTHQPNGYVGFIWNVNWTVLILCYPIANHTKSRSCMARGMGRRVRVGHRHERGIPDGQPRLVLCVPFVIHGIFNVNYIIAYTNAYWLPVIDPLNCFKGKNDFCVSLAPHLMNKIPAPPKNSTLFIANQGFWDKGKQIALLQNTWRTSVGWGRCLVAGVKMKNSPGCHWLLLNPQPIAQLLDI